jgi:hypothetical protein
VTAGPVATVGAVNRDHRRDVLALLGDAAAEHDRLRSALPPEIRESLPVDGQGVTRAIEHLATAAGFSAAERLALIRPHGSNPAVLHARVFGAAPLTRETVIGSFVDGARVRAEALTTLADAVGGPELGGSVRALLSESPLPAVSDDGGTIHALRAAYAAHERAAVMIAACLDRG